MSERVSNGVLGPPMLVDWPALSKTPLIGWAAGSPKVTPHSSPYYLRLVLSRTTVSLGKSSDTTAIMSNKSIHIDFLNDVPTGQLYAFWMMPAIFLGEEAADVLNVKDLRGAKLTTDELKRTVIGMLERRDSLPYEPGNSERYARARVTYDAAPIKPATRGIIM
jgi:hypothetical protein